MNEVPLKFVEYQKIIEPRSVRGQFRNLKTLVLVLAFAIYFLLPWLPWPRDIGPNQAVIFDLSSHKYYLFNLVLHPQDILSLAILMVFASAFLFFITTVAGRVFCGFFCFQTIWTDAFRLIERLIQGDRVTRLRLKKQKWNLEKIRKVGLTNLLWLSLAFWSGFTFTLYWAEAGQLLTDFFGGEAPLAAYICTAIITATTFLAAGFAKDVICVHICPYSRFQSAMFDENTTIVSYDSVRGEGNTGRAKPLKMLKTQEQRTDAGKGDCVDCNYCVQVCPMGIDIRDGLQVACIHCGLCIDACDSIMDKHGWARGLVKFSSENALAKKKTSRFGVRTIGYGIASLIAGGFLIFSLLNSATLTVDIAQVRSPLYVVLSDGSIQNSYRFKFYNMTSKAATFELSVEGLTNAKVDIGKLRHIKLKASKGQRVSVRVRQAEADVKSNSNQPIRFKLTPIQGDFEEAIITPSQFITP
jgi:cytochrome c oxidase accessory protein FixG